MENPRILNWRRWSPIRKAQVVLTAFGFLLTVGFVLGDALQITLPRSQLSALVFDLGLLLERPSGVLASLLGIYRNLGFWGWHVLELSINSVLS